MKRHLYINAMIQVHGPNFRVSAVAFIVFHQMGARNDAARMPDVILFLVRCPEGIRTKCDIRLRDSQTPARIRPLDLGRTRQTFFIRRFRRFHWSLRLLKV